MTAAVTFEGATPILRVADLQASIDYYVRVLGFELAWGGVDFGCVTRGKAALMLSEDTQGKAGTWVWIGVSDADALHAELTASGARIRHAPVNFPWGSRELHVFDPDGHVLRFGSDVRDGEPFGPWLDENGARWMPQPDGTWRRLEP